MTCTRPSPVGTVLVLVTIGAVSPALGACSASRGTIVVPPAVTARPTTPERPVGCRSVAAGTALQPLLDSASPGDALCLDPGGFSGPVEISRPVTLWGPRSAVIRSTGTGTTVHVSQGGSGTHLVGFSVDGSGGRYDLEDAAVSVEADDVEVRGVRIDRAVFGILVQRSNRATVSANEITGLDEQALGLRGDGIRLWEARDCVVDHNVVEHSRDVVVWYSPRNRLVGNIVRHGRYGTHFMYSSENVVEGNAYVDDVVGIFVMYSHQMTVRENLIADASGGAGIGLGLKDAGDITVVGNVFVHDTIGTYIDGSPATNGEQDVFERNVFRLGQTAVMFHASQNGNQFHRNSFRGNATTVSVEGGGDALETVWDSNDFDEYQGYDLDGDGVGDVPFELRSLSSELVSRSPSLELLHGSPAMALLDVASHIAPLFEPRTILVDRHPRMEPLAPEFSHAH